MSRPRGSFEPAHDSPRDRRFAPGPGSSSTAASAVTPSSSAARGGGGDPPRFAPNPNYRGDAALGPSAASGSANTATAGGRGGHSSQSAPFAPAAAVSTPSAMAKGSYERSTPREPLPPARAPLPVDERARTATTASGGWGPSRGPLPPQASSAVAGGGARGTPGGPRGVYPPPGMDRYGASGTPAGPASYHRSNGARAAATPSSSYPDRYPGPSASSSHRHGPAASSYSRRSPSPGRTSSSRRDRDRTDRDRDHRDRHSSSYRDRSPGSPGLSSSRYQGQASRSGKGSYTGAQSGYYASGSRRGRSPSRSPRSRSRSRSRSPPAHSRSKEVGIHRLTPIRPGNYPSKAASSAGAVSHAGPPLSYRRRRASSTSSNDDSPRAARSGRKERRSDRGRSVSRSPRSPTSSSDSNEGTGTRRTRTRRRDGDDASLKRPRSPTRDGKERFGNGAGVYAGPDAASKKAKTDALDYRRESYPPLPPAQNGIIPSSYPPLAPVVPTGPRAFTGYADSLYPLAGTGVYPAPPLADAPLSYPHPNALPTVPGASGIKVQITTSTSARPASGPGGRPGFVPIGAARDTPAAPLKTAPTPDAASSAAPSSKAHTAAGDIKRFFPGDDDESSGPSRPASRVDGDQKDTRASYSRKEERRSYDRADRMDVDDRDRLSRDSERNRDRGYGRDRERDLDRGDRDGDARGGWITRGAGDIPPPRGGRPSELDSPAARPPPPRFQPAVRNGPAPPAGTQVQVNGAEKGSYEKRASYERPPTASQSGIVTSANSVAPIAQRRWGAPSADERKDEIPAVDVGQASAEPAREEALPSTSTSAGNSAAATPSGPSDLPPVATTATPSQAAEEAAPPAPPAPTELYERLVQVGEGTYGKVYKARNVETGGLVALKRIRMEAERDGFPVTAVREIKLLQSLRHPNVVELVEMLVAKGQVYMVLEYVDHDLTGILQHPTISFSPAHLKSLMQQFLEGLGFIHRRGVLHRDLKGSNILLSKLGELKIADFGLARFYQRGRQNDYTNRVITQWYKPPELLFGATIYDERVDMWSAGCIFLELFLKRPVFPGQDEIDQLSVIFKLTGTPRVETWPGLHDLPWYELVKPRATIEPQLRQAFTGQLSDGGLDVAEALLALDPSRRPTADEALRMPYFVSEEPKAEMPTMLADVKGEWHEYESKRERARKRHRADA